VLSEALFRRRRPWACLQLGFRIKRPLGVERAVYEIPSDRTMAREIVAGKRCEAGRSVFFVEVLVCR